ncbi:MAG: 16S rRNA (cytosine(1402)-N(4))-methyltransferase RsmH, partial [Burkholderiales bacterium]
MTNTAREADKPHVTVLVREAVDALAIRADAVVVDGTFGRGGHTRAILAALGTAGQVIAVDRDPAAFEAARAIDDPRLTVVRAAFGALDEVVADCGVQQVSGVLLDVGVSSPQLDTPERGFSFRADAPLDMRMDPTSGASAADWLAEASIEEMSEVIKNYGEERFARQIAKAIAAARTVQPIRRTGQLADLVGASVRTREAGQHPATRTFQALRIHINQELTQLSLALPRAVRLLEQGGRLVVISFHSLEDRIVKQFMRDLAQPGAALGAAAARLPLRESEMPAATLRLIGRPVRASDAEIGVNPRARSAIMRVAE